MSGLGFDAQSFIDLYSAECKTCLDEGYIEVEDHTSDGELVRTTVPCPEGCVSGEEVPF